MGSILPNFEYDIFISYRHNDNRSGWVTEFVKALQEELAATIKEPVSVYFDSNPHDGLLETHNVDKSLEGKLKCLIFVPILSQTYCDPKSFAWEHEFIAFNKLAKEDSFGRDIKLSNGNVASRILPIKIHDLDADDKSTIENEIGGVVRAIEFIYKEAGVNRPLKSTDNKNDNQNKTEYRNQVNKIANAIKEIITALKNPVAQTSRTTNPPAGRAGNEQPLTNPSKPKTKFILAGAIVVLLIITGYFLYPKFNSYASKEIDKSIAVLPFIDLSPGNDQEYFSDGLSEELLNLLAKIPDLKVIGRTSSFSFKGKNEDLRTIAQKLGVAHVLEGSVRKSGNKLRITAQLISAADGAHLWSQTYDRDLDDIFKVQDDIAGAVVTELKITLLGKKISSTKQNMEAYNLCLEGRYFITRGSVDNTKIAFEKFSQALAIDSSSALAWAGLAMFYIAQGGDLIPLNKSHPLARHAAEQALRIDSTVAEAHRVSAFIYAIQDWDWPKAEASINQALYLDPLNPLNLNSAGNIATDLGKMDNAIEFYQKSIVTDPLVPFGYSGLASTLFYAGKLEAAEKAINKSIELNPSFNAVYYRLGIIQLAQGKYERALASFQKESTKTWRLSGLPLAYFKLNRKAEGDAVLKEIIEKYPDVLAYQLAENYAYRGEVEEAFKWLDRACQIKDRGITKIKVDPLLQNLRSDARWKKLLKKMNFPE